MSLDIAGGNGQEARLGDYLRDSLVVQVTDRRGEPLEGVDVRWSTAADGMIAPGGSVTDATGRASAVWRLGDLEGVQTAWAETAGLVRIEFEARALREDSMYTMLQTDRGSRFTDSLRMVIRDSAGWEALYSKYFSAPPPHQVNFDRYLVLVAATGTRPTPGYAIEIDSVHWSATRTEIHVTRDERGPSGVHQLIETAPVHIVSVPKIDAEVTWNEVVLEPQ